MATYLTKSGYNVLETEEVFYGRGGMTQQTWSAGVLYNWASFSFKVKSISQVGYRTTAQWELAVEGHNGNVPVRLENAKFQVNLAILEDATLLSDPSWLGYRSEKLEHLTFQTINVELASTVNIPSLPYVVASGTFEVDRNMTTNRGYADLEIIGTNGALIIDVADDQIPLDWEGNPSSIYSIYDNGSVRISLDDDPALGETSYYREMNGSSAGDFHHLYIRSASPYINSTTPFSSGAEVIHVSDFTDETNPTITYVYEGVSTEYTSKLEACISLTGATDDIPYREIPVVNQGSYTFELTASERQKLWTLLDSGTTGTVRFYIKTTQTTDEEINDLAPRYLTKTFRFVNYKPVVSTTVEDINSDTLALTGDKNTMVRYFSTAYFNTQAVARKGAYLAYQEVRNGDKTFSSTATEPYEGQIENISSNTFYVSVTDNRGHSTNDAVVYNNLEELKFIDYVKLTCNIKTEPLTGTGDLVVNVSGKYFNGNFGVASNKLTLDYEIHLSDSETETWVNLGVVEPTVDEEHNYSYTFTISGLNYTSSYNVLVKASDELMAYTSPSIVVSTQPVFDWGKSDFRFYVPVQMDKGFVYPQWLLWGNPDATEFSQLGADDVITLDKPISDMPTGAVLVFSLYRDGKVEDASIHSFFVSKTEVNYLLGGKPHMFMMGINSNLSIFGSKYVYISDSSLSGFSGNTASGTANCGITFDNSKFVLRYVIGV